MGNCIRNYMLIHFNNDNIDILTILEFDSKKLRGTLTPCRIMPKTNFDKNVEKEIILRCFFT